MTLAATPDPTASARVPAAAYAGLALADTWLAGQSSAHLRRLRLLTKPALMPTLMVAFDRASRSPSGSATAGRRALRPGGLAAQALSGVGDVALLSHREPAFLGGVGAFFAAHVAYAATFVANGRHWRDTSTARATLGAAGVGLALAPAVGWAAGRRSPALGRPVGAYAAMISAMVTSSTRLSEGLPPSSRRCISAGTGLFMASDSLIAARKFVMRDPRPGSDAVVMATYTAGQGLIALGLAQAARAPRPTAAPPTRVEEAGG